MAPSRLAGGLTHSSASSGIFFQGDGHSQQSLMNSHHLSSSFGTGQSNLGPVSGDINQAVFNSVANSCPSVGASSLVTDANSAFSGGPQLQRSASFNTESYMHLPASPMSFSSNNISGSNSSIIDGPSAVHQNPQQHDPNSHQQSKHAQHHHLHQGASNATPLPASQTGQVPMPMGQRIPSSSIQDPNSLLQVQKKPRLDIKPEEMAQQQMIQQLLQRQRDPSVQLQGHNLQLQALIQQQQRIRNQQLLQTMPQMQRAQLQQQQQHQQQMRNHIQQQNLQQMALMKNPYDTGGICARRLMQYLFHQRRPADNNIAYWRKFVSEYYAPRAKKRWCLSLYDNVVHHTFGVFPQAAMDAWHCEICGTKSGRGFEATYEVLPRLNEIKFSSGMVDELLFLDLPRERRFASGVMVLEYRKAVQESVYEQVRVIREGQLRIIFTQDLKILSWEFCAQRHEELLSRRLVASQVNQLLQVAQKCQNTVAESGCEKGASAQDLQSSSNMMVAAGRQLAKSLELQSLNDLCFSKRYVRCLQIAEVVNSMKDLIDFCGDNKSGPIDGLKNYPRHPSMLKVQTQGMEQQSCLQGLPSDRTTLNKFMAMQSGVNSPHQPNPDFNPNSNPTMPTANSNLPPAGGALNSSGTLSLANYQSMLIRNNSISSNPNSLRQEPSSSLNNSNIGQPSSPFEGPANSCNSNPGPPTNSVISGSITGQPMVGGFPSSQLEGAQQLHHRAPVRSRLVQPNRISQSQQGLIQPLPQAGQALEQQMIQQILQSMTNNGPSMGQSVGPDGSPSGALNGGDYQNNNETISKAVVAPITATSSNMPGSVGSGVPTLSKSNSFRTGSNSDSSAAGGGGEGVATGGFNPKAVDGDASESMHLTDEMVQEMTNDFTDSGFFNSDIDDNIGYAWKA